MQYKTIILELLQQTAADARPAAEGPQAPDGNGTLRQGAEEEPRSLEGTALPDEAGERPEPDRFGGVGDSPQGTGGSFALRVATGRATRNFPSTRQWRSSAVIRRAAETRPAPADAV